jgi:membrane associated rhomboid family serine protease
MLIPLYDENPTQTVPVVTVGLIIINILVFLYELSLGSALQPFITRYAMTPVLLSEGKNYFTIFTAMFLHGGFVHVGGNMLYLWIFGNNVEDTLGHVGFGAFYLLAGIGGAIGHLLSAPGSQVPSLGASGAIAGVLAAYIFLFPGAYVVSVLPLFIFIRIIRLPALLVIGFWIVIQFLNGVASIVTQPTTTEMAGGVAWFAHIGGFVVGLVLILLMPKRRRRGQSAYT